MLYSDEEKFSLPNSAKIGITKHMLTYQLNCTSSQKKDEKSFKKYQRSLYNLQSPQRPGKLFLFEVLTEENSI